MNSSSSNLTAALHAARPHVAPAAPSGGSLADVLPDVQGFADARAVALSKAGVRDLLYPIVVRDRAHRQQSTVARVAMSVDLPHHFKGTHMSRFIEILNRRRGDLTLPELRGIVRELEERLDASTGHISVEFPYFLERRAPVSGASALLDVQCRLQATGGVRPVDLLSVTVPVCTLCPCSKAISDYGAHNQRTFVTASLECHGFVWIEDIVDLVEAASSCPVFPLLKRPDEKWVTERAYDNPRFVEDVVRDAAIALREMPCVGKFSVEATSIESIHNHNAYALVEGTGPAEAA